MPIDYAAVNAMMRRHKSALTRAKKKGPEAVLAAVDAFFADFDNKGVPLPDNWHTWNIAKYDAENELRRNKW